MSISPERLRQILRRHDITFQRTKTWKESNDPDRDAKLDRIEEALERHPERCFAFDEFGPLSVRPVGGSAWAPEGRPQRQPANYHKLHDVRQFHGCDSISDDTLWGVVRRRKSATNTLAALKSIRAARSDDDWIYVILDYNLVGRPDAPDGQYSAVAAGGDHSCGLRTDGTITCWGRNRDGQADAPGGQYSAVAAGSNHSCGLRTNGTITCWGAEVNNRGRADAPGGQYSAVAAGGDHSCGLRTDGTITCWGYNFDGQADAPGGQHSAVAAGRSHSCGLRTNGTITCWGAEVNNRGQADAPGGQHSAVAAGRSHSCGLRTDGTITCWGFNWDGQADAPDG